MMTLDKATEEYIKKHYLLQDGKLYKIREINFRQRNVYVNRKPFLKRQVIEYLQTGEYFERKLHKNNNTDHRGISYLIKAKRWVARLFRDGSKILNSRYKTKEEAIQAYNKALDEYNSKRTEK